MPLSNDPIEAKRQVHVPPFAIGDFNPGEFIYLPDSPFEELRSGMVVERSGAWFVLLRPKKLMDPWEEMPLTAFTERIGRDILVDYSGLGEPRGAAIDPTPWLVIKRAVITALEAAPSYRLRLGDLISLLKLNTELDSDCIADVLQMCATMGVASVTTDKVGIWYGLSKLLVEDADRRRYLASFSEELLVKSRRIDHLIRHTGTVGGYREGLLRNMLRQVLPQRYEISTGFIENCPRQLDIIIWDSHRFGALFRDGDIVVVPAPSVRAVIEVKTTLGTTSLDEALEILDDVMRIDQPLLPVFKGIFAFESNYAQSASIADRVRTFYLGKMPHGAFTREHNYLYQGVQLVCVPHAHLVRHSYQKGLGSKLYPRPSMRWYDTSEKEDLTTAAFIYEILMYLDIDPAAKRTQLQLYRPLLRYLKEQSILQLFGDDWHPRLRRCELEWTGSAEGADKFIQKFLLYRDGEISADDLIANTDVPSP